MKPTDSTAQLKPVRQRTLLREDYNPAGVERDMRGVRGSVFVGSTCTVYLARCKSSRLYHGGWWVQCGLLYREVRTEKVGCKLAKEWATNGLPIEEK